MSSRDDTLPAGWAVRIVTKRLGGGQPMQELYAVAISDPTEAEEAVKRRTGSTSDEDVAAVAILKQSSLDLVGAKPGDVVAM